jgi:hypothetical protein
LHRVPRRLWRIDLAKIKLP